MIGITTADREAEPSEHDEESSAADRPNDEISRLGFYRDDRFYLKQGGHSKVFTHFKNFYVHRVQHVGLNKQRPGYN